MLIAVLLSVHAGIAMEPRQWFDEGLERLAKTQYHEAIAAFSKAIDSGFRRADGFNNRGVCRFYIGDLDRAIEDYTAAVGLNPNFGDAFKNRGGAWFYKKFYARAIADYTRSLDVNPQDPDTLYHRGVARFFLGEYRQALEDYTRAVERKSDFAAAYNQIAWILATCPDPEIRDGSRALEMVRKSLNLQPDPEFYDTLAAVYAELGRFDDAVSTQQMVVGAMERQKDSRELAVSRLHLKTYQAGRPWREHDASIAVGRSVDAFLSDWREVWERADLEAYLAFYHPDAVQGSLKGRDRIAEHKRSLWQRQKPRAIILGRPRVNRQIGFVEVSFDQEYAAGQGYSDAGQKTLTLTPYGDRWLITREQWMPDKASD